VLQMLQTKLNNLVSNIYSQRSYILLGCIWASLGTALALDYGVKRAFVAYAVASLVLVIILAIRLINTEDFPASLLVLSAFSLWLCITALWSNNLMAANNFVPHGLGITLAWASYFASKRSFNVRLFTYFIIGMALAVEIISFFTIRYGRMFFGLMLPNQVATIMSIGMASAFYMALNAKKGLTNKWLLSLITLLLGYGLLKTASRGAILGLTIALLIYAGYRYKSTFKWIKRHTTVLLIAGAFLLLMVPLGVISKFDRPSTDNFHDRYMYAKAAIELFKERPVFGNGIGSFQVVGLPLQTGVQSLTKNAHASFLQLLAETGIVGVSLLVGSFVYLYREIKRRHTSWTKLYVCLLLIYCLQASVDLHLEYTSIIYIFYVLFGITVATAHSE